MNRAFNFAALALPACLLVLDRSPAQALKALPAASPVNDTARFLAGLEPNDPALKELTANESWQRHAKYFNTAWSELDRKQLTRIREWTGNHTPAAATGNGTLFYMFSGPDFLYANTFFPQATTYVLCGIEPIGPIPDLSLLRPDQIGSELRDIQSSLDSVLNFSFFITKEMKEDFRNHALSGTLPVLYIFLERSGMTLLDVSYVSVDDNGTLGAQPDPARPLSKAPGVQITFLPNGSSSPRTLYYFSTDISNEGLKQSGFLRFCKTLAPGNSFVKSASYLMHEKAFSSIRDFLLENTLTLIQDDSGIPCSFFSRETWNLSVFGSYPGPIPLFKEYTQPLLADYYKSTRPAPLDFGIGYRHHAEESTLMVATRKQSSGNQDSAAATTPTPLKALPVPEEPRQQ